MTWQVLRGDCCEVMAGLDDCSVDSVVCDPPAGISFMGRTWDHHKGGMEQWIDWMAEVMTEAKRVAKPGAHALVWALPRTSHWTGMAIERAGWEVRDRIAHHFGSGFPKSHNLPGGLGTALKPATEDWWLARKPFPGTVSSNVLTYGTGALAIDRCRVGNGGQWKWTSPRGEALGFGGESRMPAESDEGVESASTRGRWPANVVLSHTEECVPVGTRKVKGSGQHLPHHRRTTAGGNEHTHGAMAGVTGHDHVDPDGTETITAWQCSPDCPVRLLDEQTGELHGAGHARDAIREAAGSGMWGMPGDGQRFGDSGGASRFFATFGPCGDELIGAGLTSDGESREAARSTPNSNTDGSGKKPTDPSRPGMTSTTETATDSTTNSPTSNSSSEDDTRPTTAKREQQPSSKTASVAAPDASSGDPSQTSPTELTDPASPTAATAATPIYESGEHETESGTPPTCAPIEQSTETRFRYVAKASRAERTAGVDANVHPT